MNPSSRIAVRLLKPTKVQSIKRTFEPIITEVWDSIKTNDQKLTFIIAKRERT